MQSRAFLRIEGDLVSQVTEMIDREVSLPDPHRMGTSHRVAWEGLTEIERVPSPPEGVPRNAAMASRAALPRS